MTARGPIDATVSPRTSAIARACALAAVMAQPEVRARLSGMGAEVVASSPERLTEFINARLERWSQVITPAMRIE